MHGGGSPQVKQAARRRLERERLTLEVGRLLDELDPEDVQHPVEVLLEAVQRSASMGRLLEQLVALLQPTYDSSILDERGRTLAALWGPDHLGDQAPHVLLSLLGEWTDRQAKLAKVALDANLEERRTRIAESQIITLQDALDAALADAGVSAEVAANVQRSLGLRLRPAELTAASS